MVLSMHEKFRFAGASNLKDNQGLLRLSADSNEQIIHSEFVQQHRHMLERNLRIGR